MRILHVVTVVDDDHSYGGPLTVALDQCAELRARGHDAHLLAGHRGTGEGAARERGTGVRAAGDRGTEIAGVPAHLFGVRSVIPGMRFSGLLSLRLLRWAYRHAGSFDVVHVHLARDLIPLLTAAIAGRAGTPVVVQTHGMIVPDDRPAARILDRLLTRRALRHAVARLVLTAQERDDVQRVVGADSPLTVLRNGVTVPEHRAVGREPADVLFLGRLHPRKRVLDFAHAALALSQEGVPARFSVVGPDDGDLPELRRLIEDRPGAADVLRYEGAMSHDRAVARMAAADIFVLPAVDEPFGMTLLEAMAAGVPSVCTTGCGLAEELSAAGSVLAVEPGVEALTAAVRRLVHDGEYRSRLGVAGRRTVEARYSMREVGEQLLGIYQRAR